MISRLQVGIVNMLNPHPLLMRVLRKARERWRRDRQRVLLRAVQLPPGAKIVDLGGTEDLWRLIDHDFHVTLVNLPGFNPPVSDTDRFTVVQADCCELGPIFQDSSFDLSFSNATIEHVGEECRQARFAAEVRRLAPAYWIETPSPFCPIECHTGIPFYWYLPQSVREAILKDWSRRYPRWVEWLRETRVLSRERMQQLFPDAQIHVERVFGFEKSYSLFRPYPEALP